jgi:hypothetical protein
VFSNPKTDRRLGKAEGRNPTIVHQIDSISFQTNDCRVAPLRGLPNLRWLLPVTDSPAHPIFQLRGIEWVMASCYDAINAITHKE